jgi:hypothetical protein
MFSKHKQKSGVQKRKEKQKQDEGKIKMGSIRFFTPAGGQR